MRLIPFLHWAAQSKHCLLFFFSKLTPLSLNPERELRFARDLSVSLHSLSDAHILTQIKLKMSQSDRRSNSDLRSPIVFGNSVIVPGNLARYCLHKSRTHRRIESTVGRTKHTVNLDGDWDCALKRSTMTSSVVTFFLLGSNQPT